MKTRMMVLTLFLVMSVVVGVGTAQVVTDEPAVGTTKAKQDESRLVNAKKVLVVKIQDIELTDDQEARIAAIRKEFRPQVLLSDIAMPGADGLTFIRQIRRLGSDQGGDVPAAALTALAGEEDRQRALQAGFQVHAPKPIDAARVSALVRLLADWSPSGEAKQESV